MIYPQCLELPISRTIFHGPKVVRTIEVQVYSFWCKFDQNRTNDKEIVGIWRFKIVVMGGAILNI